MEEFKVYPYRWIILSVFMIVVAANQVMWITFAPITIVAADFYQVSDLMIGLLSMIFMIVYIVVSIPASWIIDTYGIRTGVGIGVVLTGIFGIFRGIFASDYNMVLVAQVGLAVAQPFLLNAITSLSARWFPIRERATASGLGTLAMYVGIAAGMTVTPLLTEHSGIQRMLVIYGVFSLVALLLFFVLMRERPPTAPCRPDQEERSLVWDGFRQIFRKPGFLLLMAIFFIGLGIFNSVTTWIEDILRPRGFSVTQAGMTGGAMILGGIIGALVMPILSDRFRRRVPFIIAALAGTVIGLAGVTFATGYGLVLAAAFAMGFFLLSAGPIGFQYGAEITFPTLEGTSNGLLLLMGQISGIAFIVLMDVMKSPATGSMTMPLAGLIGLMIVCVAASFWLKEPEILSK